MNRPVPDEPHEFAGADDEPFMLLPRPEPRWLRRATDIHTAFELVVIAIVLLMAVAGTVAWAVRGIT